MKEVLTLLRSIKGIRVLCVGDIMVDRYIYGQATRISPEAPVPVVRVKRHLLMPGGVGNVVKNLGALEALPLTVSVTGRDSKSTLLSRLFAEDSLPAPHLIIDENRPTSVKTRIIAGIQQVVRFDEEDTTPISGHVAEELLSTVNEALGQVRAVAISDYGKGTLPDDVLSEIISLASAAGTPVVVDPKGSDYSRYRGATLVTPNRSELSEAIGHKVESAMELELAGREVMARNGLLNILITRSEDGMMLLHHGAPEGDPVLLPSQAREVFDVSGAGDTVVAVMAAALALGAPLALGARLANIAAGVVVGKVGTATATADEIEDWYSGQSSAYR
ncbi:D-glycero-beta-D-manno-heptose-7-phosphate kinase [Deltaproteobacteria bacterium Smac51]|nr:D-glycero-beta-D-manno-heptose-7-phosphate kinase [Deltaproteobacteria bacterium Smac51]